MKKQTEKLRVALEGIEIHLENTQNFINQFNSIKEEIEKELDRIDNLGEVKDPDPIPDPDISEPDAPKEKINISKYEKPFPFTKTVGAKYYQNIPIDRNGRDKDESFNLYLPQGFSEDSSLIIYMHGGGFHSGNKIETNKVRKALDMDWDFPRDINTLLNNNIAFISLGYAKMDLTNPKGTPNIRQLYERLMYSIQYIRYHAPNLGIKRNRIILTGISAGSIFSQWLHFSDDMRDTNNIDPVKQMSTKPYSIAPRFVHTIEDVDIWEDEIFKEFGFNMLHLYNSMPASNKREVLAKYQAGYDIDRMEDLYGSKFKNFVKTINSVHNISEKIGEFWLGNFWDRNPKNIHELGHHGNHAKWLHEYCMKNGQTNHTIYWGPVGSGKQYPRNAESWIEFVLRKSKE